MGSRAYQREVANEYNDNDPSAIYRERGDNVYSEVRSFYRIINSKGKEITVSELHGYAPLNKALHSWEEVLKKLPKNLILVRYPNDAIEITKKVTKIEKELSQNKLEKLEKLFSKK